MASNLMIVPKKYLQDRMIVLMLSINGFIVVVNTLFVLLRLSGGGSGYISEYRANLGLSAFKPGDAGDIMGFVVFAFMIFVLTLLLSIRVYHIRHQLARIVLAFGLILLVFSAIVSNALLELR